MKIQGKTVLITGASMGLGRELAFEFHRRGARLILTARSLDKLKELVVDLKTAHPTNPHDPEFCYLDVAEPNGGLEEVRRRCATSGLHVIVHNAGLSMRGSVRETPIEVLRQVMEVNFFGPALLTRELLPLMSTDGALLVISSLQGLIAVPYRSSYTASKHALQVQEYLKYLMQTN